MRISKTLYWAFLATLMLTARVALTEDEDDDDATDDDSNDGDAVREEEGVLVLTDDNFDSVVDSNDVMLVELYAPWCGHCKTLAPEYAKAATILKSADYPVPLAKVDATVNQEVATRLGVTGYPTLKFWKDKEWLEYDGPRDSAGIVEWVSQKADPNYKPPPETVTTLTKDNFEEFINSEELVLVEFYAPWCGHCKRLAPEYEKAAQRLILHEPPIPLGKVDATIETELAQQFGVTGYPTLKMFRNGRAADYNGGRDAFGIVDYMHKNSGEAAKLQPTLADVKKLISKETVTYIGFFDNLEDEKLRAYMNVANDKREDYTFGYTLLPEARDLYKVNAGSVVAFTPEKFQTKYEPKYNVLKTTGKSEEDIASFILEYQVPLVGEFTQENSKFYEGYKKDTLCLAFYTVDWSFDYRDTTQAWRKKVARIAKDYKDIKFAIANEETFMDSLMKELGLDDSGEEFNIGCYMVGNKYRMEPMDEFDDDEIKDFLKKLKKGKLTPQLKSQSVPKKNSGPVKVVVGKTFDKIVLDKTKDVLIEFYAPWCGHCKSLEPVYKDLGKSLKKEKNLVIAKIDATANDVPDNYKVEGFPTIYYAAANNKNSPVKYEGERTVEGFTKYLQENAVASFSGSKKDEL